MAGCCHGLPSGCKSCLQYTTKYSRTAHVLEVYSRYDKFCYFFHEFSKNLGLQNYLVFEISNPLASCCKGVLRGCNCGCSNPSSFRDRGLYDFLKFYEITELIFWNHRICHFSWNTKSWAFLFGRKTCNPWENPDSSQVRVENIKLGEYFYT